MCKISDVKRIQKQFKIINDAQNILAKSLPSKNIIGEVGELLVHNLYGGTKNDASHKSSDILGDDGLEYQVKAKKSQRYKVGNLGAIRNWDFDYLCVVLMDLDGIVYRSIQMPARVAKHYGKWVRLENGWLINVSQKFLNDPRAKNITELINTASELNEVKASTI